MRQRRLRAWLWKRRPKYRAKQSRAGKGKAGQGRAGQRRGQGRAGHRTRLEEQDEAEQGGKVTEIEQDRAVWGWISVHQS